MKHRVSRRAHVEAACADGSRAGRDARPGVPLSARPLGEELLGRAGLLKAVAWPVSPGIVSRQDEKSDLTGPHRLKRVLGLDGPISVSAGLLSPVCAKLLGCLA